MSIIFCIGLIYVIISITGIIISTFEYFTNDTITKKIVREYKNALKISITLLIIGMIFISISIYFNGIPKLLGW